MEFTEVIRHRHMVRRFTDEPVSVESLDRILHNAVRGPSAGFSQGQAFLVLTDPEDHEPIGAIAIGHDAEPAPRDLRARRRAPHDVIHYGRW